MDEQEKKADQGGEERGWERDLINRLSFAALNEQRRARRWSIFFKSLFFVYLFVLLFLAIPSDDFKEAQRKAKEHTALIEVNGMISDATDANADTIIEGVRNALEDERTKGVILRINSPGGSPVQSDYVFREIRRLRAIHENTPIYAVIVDVGASGAYYIASASDEIYVNPASLVGSIGVLMNGFGFTETMDKLGIERRMLTAGDNKGMLDPFSPLRDEDVAHARDMLQRIHRQFIAAVKEGRGERLKDDPQIFSGLFWSGDEAVELGLADGIGDVDYVARELVGAESVVDFTPQPDVWERFARRLGASMANTLGSQLGVSLR